MIVPGTQERPERRHGCWVVLAFCRCRNVGSVPAFSFEWLRISACSIRSSCADVLLVNGKLLERFCARFERTTIFCGRHVA